MRALFLAVGWWVLASVVCLVAIGAFLFQLRRREQPKRRPAVVVVPDQPTPGDGPAGEADEGRPGGDAVAGGLPGPLARGQLLHLQGTYRLECLQCELALEIRLPAAAVTDISRQTDEFVSRHTHGDIAPRVTIRLD